MVIWHGLGATALARKGDEPSLLRRTRGQRIRSNSVAIGGGYRPQYSILD
jgi:hypothetical protein